MSGAMCAKFPACFEGTSDATVPKCAKPDCPGRETFKPFIHALMRDNCDHDFQGWREHKNEKGQVIGGEQVCAKCGLGAMAHTLSLDF